jgi:4,5:9,10-diseco-3-hydroxy-5,9,17-trioxoandrosta-1(10),2-diene-4-oate hydrolase
MKEANYRQDLIDNIGVPVAQKDVSAGAVKTAYLSAGTGFPVVCLHGAGAGAVTWYPSFAALAGHFHVIAPDIVGYGESDKPNAAYDRPYFAAWLRDFLSALGISKAHIVGLSQGGAIALQFALENPEMVERLVLVDSGALGGKPSFFPFFGMVWMNSIPSGAANRFVSRYLLVDPENRDPNHGHYSVHVLRMPGGRNAFKQGRGAAVSTMPEGELQQIKHRTMIIWGEDDKFFSIAHGEAAVRIMPNAILHRIQNAGHLPLMDQPVIFNKALIQFLNE